MYTYLSIDSDFKDLVVPERKAGKDQSLIEFVAGPKTESTEAVVGQLDEASVIVMELLEASR